MNDKFGQTNLAHILCSCRILAIAFTIIVQAPVLHAISFYFVILLIYWSFNQTPMIKAVLVLIAQAPPPPYRVSTNLLKESLSSGGVC